MVDELAAENKEISEKTPARGWARTALVAGASMLVGGIAVAIWNRRALTHLREDAGTSIPSEPPIDDEI